MSAYSAIASLSRRPAAAAGIAGLLQSATSTRSPYFSDGVHLNACGLREALPLIKAVLEEVDADACVSDSSLCAGETDRWGEMASRLLPLPTVAWWGASFTGKTFAKAVLQVWKGNRDAKSIAVFIAGNDCKPGNDRATVQDALVQLRKYWLEIGVELIYIDVVPDAYRDVEIDDKA